MAAASAACIGSVGTRFLGPQRTIALRASQFLPSFSLARLGFNHLRLRTTVPTSRKLVARAARTESKGVSLGFRAPDFELPEPLTGKVWKLTDFESYPALLDGPQFMAEEAKLFNFAFPYLYDETKDAARDFGAACTPEFFLFKRVEDMMSLRKLILH